MKFLYHFRSMVPLILVLHLSSFSFAQSDPEFPKGFIMYAKMHSGMVTDFSSGPDLFTGGIQLAPQVTVVPHVLRAGLIADAFYTSKKIQAAFGPSLSLKLKTFNANMQGAQIGSIGNINLLIDHLWGTGKQRLIGGGVIMDLGNLITVGLTSHRDYQLKTWWFQTEVGIRISKKKKNPVI